MNKKPSGRTGWSARLRVGDLLVSDGASYLLPAIVADARRRLPQGRKPGLVTDDEYQPVTVSRRICAPAHGIFQVLADPARHLEFDGSGSLRGAGSTALI